MVSVVTQLFWKLVKVVTDVLVAVATLPDELLGEKVLVTLHVKYWILAVKIVAFGFICIFKYFNR